MTTSMSGESPSVIAEQRRFADVYVACSLHKRAVCHVVPTTDRLSVCAALTGAGEH